MLTVCYGVLQYIPKQPKDQGATSKINEWYVETQIEINYCWCDKTGQLKRFILTWSQLWKYYNNLYHIILPNPVYFAG